jgi:hypothetical protein
MTVPSFIRATQQMDSMRQAVISLPSFSAAHGAFKNVTGHDELPTRPPAKELASWLPEKTSGHGALLALLDQDAAAADQRQSLCACLRQIASRGAWFFSQARGSSAATL